MARECADGHVRAMIHRTFFSNNQCQLHGFTRRVRATQDLEANSFIKGGPSSTAGRFRGWRPTLERIVVGQTLLFRPSTRSAGF